MIDIDNGIKKQFQSKFNDFRAPLPEKGWEEIEKALNTASKIKSLRKKWFVGVAATLAAIIGGGLLFMQQPELQTNKELTDAALPQRSPVMKTEKTNTQADVPATPENKKQYTPSQPQPQQRIKKTLLAALPDKQREVTQIPAELSNANSATTGENETNIVTEKDKEQLIRAFAESGSKNYFVEQEMVKPHKNNGILLALGGRGGLTTSQKTVNAPMSLRSAPAAGNKNSESYKSYQLSFAKDETANIADNIAQMEHAQPISFGVTVSKEVLDNLYIETGLIYTYLSSKARNTNLDMKSSESQHFHYLGIPLNINYVLFSVHKLDVYASLGGMAEKDIHGEFRYARKVAPDHINGVSQNAESDKIRQKNLQFSINAGVGVSYPIYKNLQLYGKIGGAYYFDAKNEYKTIYSDRKILLDLNVGLRVEF